MGTPTNIVIGMAAENTLKVGNYGESEAQARDAGFLKGGISIEHSEAAREIKVDQALGAIDKVVTDEDMKVKLTLAEPTLANIALAYGYAYESGDFSFGDKTAQAHRTLYINVKGPNGGNRKFVFWKARPTGKTSQAYKRDNETVIDVEFDILTDTSKPQAKRFGCISDSGPSSSNPSAALSIPAEGGTLAAGSSAALELLFTCAYPLDEGTLAYGDTVCLTKAGTPPALVAATLRYEATPKKLSIQPAQGLAAGTYCLTVSTGVKDTAGAGLAAPYVTYFTVA